MYHGGVLMFVVDPTCWQPVFKVPSLSFLYRTPMPCFQTVCQSFVIVLFLPPQCKHSAAEGYSSRSKVQFTAFPLQVKVKRLTCRCHIRHLKTYLFACPRTDGTDPLVSFSVYRTCRLFCVLRVLAVFGVNATLFFSLITILIIIIK